MSKHTQGPWKAKSEIVETVWGKFICETGSLDSYTTSAGSEIRLANAKLIAAAPEMLDALRIAAGQIEESLCFGKDTPEKRRAYVVVMDAIKKAEGVE